MNFLKKLFAPKKETINLEYPISWEQMDINDFKEVCIILNKRLSDNEKLLLCLCRLSGIIPDNPRLYKYKAIQDKLPVIIGGKRYIIGSKVITEACEQLRFILNDKEGLPPCPFKNVQRMLYGTTFKQFFEADSYILRYVAEENASYLKEAAKTLTNGQKRKLQEWERTALLLWWNGVKRQLLKKYPYVLEEGAGISNKSQADILIELLSAMNGDKPQENENILKADVHYVMATLNKMYEDAKRRASK